VTITHAGGKPIIADTTRVMFYNHGQEYRRGAISPDGDRCHFLALPAEAVAAASRLHGPGTAELDPPFGAPTHPPPPPPTPLPPPPAGLSGGARAATRPPCTGGRGRCRPGWGPPPGARAGRPAVRPATAGAPTPSSPPRPGACSPSASASRWPWPPSPPGCRS